MCKNQGADVMVTEFVQADAIIRGDDRLWETVDFSELKDLWVFKSLALIH